MLKIVKEWMEHKGYSVMQNPEYWENDAWASFESIVEYVSKELPKLFASGIRCGLYNLPDYKYIRDYRELIGMDVKAGFNIVLTDEEVDCILSENNITPMPRFGGEICLAEYGF